ncbi:MAG: ribulose-phosphate 3-epimerase [Spirochaetota bacterium]
MARPIRISPSLMCADFIDLKRTLDLFSQERIEPLHIDIMDGHYVPNFTLGIDYCLSVARYTALALDIHLMIENVDDYIPSFAAIRDSVVTIHSETCYHPLRSIELIRRAGARAGIAIDPSLPIESYKHLIPAVDQVCIMTVNPGYAGQKLIPQTLEKIRELAELCGERGYDIDIEVDGNVSWTNMPLMIDAGASVLVAGTSSLFDKSSDLCDNLARMRSVIHECKDRRAVSIC